MHCVRTYAQAGWPEKTTDMNAFVAPRLRSSPRHSLTSYCSILRIFADQSTIKTDLCKPLFYIEAGANGDIRTLEN